METTTIAPAGAPQEHARPLQETEAARPQADLQDPMVNIWPVLIGATAVVFIVVTAAAFLLWQ
ncbi:hypothetical protein RGQ15_06240 [Paracoccus sp. MBLB3053]|uniref:Uncharacterized protein n=1 Tax=Paracoccus aurantius TaxID=3073814 RepID=A0ABU2HQ54_9RHOB|nr:hypothetical protein [Paracoccus sp. MBLB3053]MDS9467171.1 hypothetical protein [Paracoccus sp. MBLB3053]